MKGFLERIRAGETLIADGATGTNLQRAGLEAGTQTEDWVLDRPDAILELEKAFVAAGADVLLTCTFGGTRLRMQGARHADEVIQVNRRAVELARQAAATGTGVMVAGSMGPVGQLLIPYGPITREEARAAFAEQAAALAQAGADLIVIETHFALEEATAAFEGARSAADLPIIVSFSYDRGARTMMGVRPTDVIRKFKSMGAALVGANCGTTLKNARSVIEEYAGAEAGFPLWAKPNAGLPRLEGTRTVYDVTPAEMGRFAKQCLGLGARVVGGCCGSTPEHIAAIAQAVKE
jgi:5-methyltetrahydrofolate--homocysteine methyltransferase